MSLPKSSRKRELLLPHSSVYKDIVVVLLPPKKLFLSTFSETCDLFSRKYVAEQDMNILKLCDKRKLLW